MSPRILILLLLVCGAGVLLFPLLGPSDPDAGPEVPIPPFPWTNRLVVPSPPVSAYQPAILEDPVQRTVERLLWGSTEIVQFSQTHLPSDHEQLRRRIQERLEGVAGSTSLASRHLLETLGLIGTRECIPTLLQYATQDPDYLQISAIEALAHCPLESRVQDTLAELSGHPNLQVRGAAMRSAVNRPEQWDTEQIVAYLEAFEGEAVRVLIHEVGRRQIFGAADAVARHLEATLAHDRHLAAGALMKLQDERGFQATESELRSLDSRRVQAALTLYRDAKALPPLDLARLILDQGDPDMRVALARALRITEGEDAETKASAIRLLERLVDSGNPSLRLAAIGSLHGRGQFAFLAAFRRDLAQAHGEALKEAVKFLCEELRDEESAPILRQRLAGELEPTDRVQLLFGLRFVGGASDLPPFLEWMHRAGTSEDRVAGVQTELSLFATLYVQTFGAAAAPGLRQGLSEAQGIRARLCFLDAIRGVAAMAPELLDDVVARLLDPQEALEVRLAAADSLPYFWSPALGTSVRAWSDEVQSREVAQRLLSLYVSYF